MCQTPPTAWWMTLTGSIPSIFADPDHHQNVSNPQHWKKNISCLVSRIQDPGSKDTGSRINNKNWSILKPKYWNKLSDMIRNVHFESQIWIFSPRVHGSKRHRIPDPQHWCTVHTSGWMQRFFLELSARPTTLTSSFTSVWNKEAWGKLQ